MPASLAYRKNQDAIWRGHPPEKYTRLVPLVPGQRILEIGAAEGVLSLLLAESGKIVTAVERRDVRHEEALILQARWKKLGRKVDGCNMLMADIAKCPDLMKGMDTLVGIRVMYHLRDQAQPVIDAAAKAGVRHIVLCGNKNRAARFEAGTPDEGLGHWNYYSTVAGMSELITNAGYLIRRIIREGDPVVIGTHRSP